MSAQKDAAPIWILMVAMADPAMTEAALSDCLAQSVPVRVLLILQGVDPAFQDRFQAIAEQDPRLLVWSHDPALPSLAATWNAGLRFVWETGGEEALVVNNDVRLHTRTLEVLDLYRHDEDALFISAVGVTKEQFNSEEPTGIPSQSDGSRLTSKGGPDFSCFLITKEGHARFPFDEGFIPAYCEDLDTHRRYLLDGAGDRIFSINLPYWHIGSGTLKAMNPEARARHERSIGTARAHYARKWGGPVNQERYTIPFDAETAQDGVTTPELQALHQRAPEQLPGPTTCTSCGSKGFAPKIGERADGTWFNGCEFCCADDGRDTPAVIAARAAGQTRVDTPTTT